MPEEESDDKWVEEDEVTFESDGTCNLFLSPFILPEEEYDDKWVEEKVMFESDGTNVTVDTECETVGVEYEHVGVKHETVGAEHETLGVVLTKPGAKTKVALVHLTTMTTTIVPTMTEMVLFPRNVVTPTTLLLLWTTRLFPLEQMG